jgi:alkanesulfonate monooxygenase SsuD/methylene tetrahydromethanopterin reductase-like flavin-dependent oxidoreductase (luciferase family)
MGESRERFVESAEMILAGLEQGYCEYNGKHIKQPKARIRPEPFKSFKNRTYAAAVSAESSMIMAKLGIGVLVIPQKPWAVHAQELSDYNDLFMQIHGRAAPNPYVAGWVVCDKDAGRAEELAREYIVGYWRSVVQHYEMSSNHFETTKGYEYYTNLNKTIEQMGHPIGNCCSRHLRHACDGGKVRHGHDAGHDLCIYAGRRDSITETEKGLWFKKELSDGATRA